jgi:hypothetical protein
MADESALALERFLQTLEIVCREGKPAVKNDARFNTWSASLDTTIANYLSLEFPPILIGESDV